MDKSNERIIFEKHIIFLFFIVYSIDRSSAVIHPPILLTAMSAQWGFFFPPEFEKWTGSEVDSSAKSNCIDVDPKSSFTDFIFEIKTKILL